MSQTLSFAKLHDNTQVSRPIDDLRHRNIRTRPVQRVGHHPNPRSPNPPLFPNESFSRQTTERVHTGSSETSAKSTSYCTRRNRQRGFIQHKRIRNCDSTIIRLRSSPCVGSFAKHYYVIYKQTCEHLAPVPALNAHKRRGLGSAADDNYYMHIHEYYAGET